MIVRMGMVMVMVMGDVGIDIQFCTIIIIIRIIQLRHVGRWRLCHVVVDLCVLVSMGAAKMYGSLWLLCCGSSHLEKNLCCSLQSSLLCGVRMPLG